MILFPNGRKVKLVPIPSTESTENPQLAHPVETSPKILPPPTNTLDFCPFNLLAVTISKEIFIPIRMPVAIKRVESSFENAVNIPSRRVAKTVALKTRG